MPVNDFRIVAAQATVSARLPFFVRTSSRADVAATGVRGGAVGLGEA